MLTVEHGKEYVNARGDRVVCYRDVGLYEAWRFICLSRKGMPPYYVQERGVAQYSNGLQDSHSYDLVSEYKYPRRKRRAAILLTNNSGSDHWVELGSTATDARLRNAIGSTIVEVVEGVFHDHTKE